MLEREAGDAGEQIELRGDGEGGDHEHDQLAEEPAGEEGGVLHRLLHVRHGAAEAAEARQRADGLHQHADGLLAIEGEERVEDGFDGVGVALLVGDLQLLGEEEDVVRRQAQPRVHHQARVGVAARLHLHARELDPVLRHARVVHHHLQEEQARLGQLAALLEDDAAANQLLRGVRVVAHLLQALLVQLPAVHGPQLVVDGHGQEAAQAPRVLRHLLHAVAEGPPLRSLVEALSLLEGRVARPASSPTPGVVTAHVCWRRVHGRRAHRALSGLSEKLPVGLSAGLPRGNPEGFPHWLPVAFPHWLPHWLPVGFPHWFPHWFPQGLSQRLSERRREGLFGRSCEGKQGGRADADAACGTLRRKGRRKGSRRGGK